MVRKFIQIRGSSGAGKTTAVTQYTGRKGMSEKTFVDDCGREYKFFANESELVLGKYCGGKVDGLDSLSHNAEEVLRIIKFAVGLGYRMVIVEGLIYGKTQNFAYSIRRIVERAGYTYYSIFLYADDSVLADRVQKRSGRKINPTNIWDANRECLRTHKRLLKRTDGIAVDTTKVEKDRMWEIIGGITDG